MNNRGRPPTGPAMGAKYHDFAERLRKEIENLKISQEEVAKKISSNEKQITKNTVGTWCLGKSSPDWYQMERLASLGISINYIITGEKRSEFRRRDDQVKDKIVTLLENMLSKPDGLNLRISL